MCCALSLWSFSRCLEPLNLAADRSGNRICRHDWCGCCELELCDWQTGTNTHPQTHKTLVWVDFRCTLFDIIDQYHDDKQKKYLLEAILSTMQIKLYVQLFCITVCNLYMHNRRATNTRSSTWNETRLIMQRRSGLMHICTLTVRQTFKQRETLHFK